MKIAINTLPLSNGHKGRGIGLYTRNLLAALESTEEVEIVRFEDAKKLKSVDVVYYPWFDLFSHTLPIKKPFPVIVTIHDVIPLLFPDAYPMGLRAKVNLALQKLSLRNTSYIVTDSICSKNDILKKLGVSEKRICVIPLAADKQFQLLSDTKRIFIKNKYHLPDCFILYVGDANYVKNLPFLIEGFNKLVEIERFSSLKLVLVNAVFKKKVDDIDHPELKSLKQFNRLIQNYRLEDAVIRLGQVETEDLVGIYNLATVYVQPSLYEGFGLPILEAMACGTPVISSNAASLPEVGGPPAGGAAVYFDPLNVDQFIKVLSDVLLDASLRTKMSQLGINRSKQFSWRKVASETLAVCQQTIKGA